MGILRSIENFVEGSNKEETEFLPALSLPDVLRERIAAQEAEHVRGLKELAGLDGSIGRQFSSWRFQATHPGDIQMAFKAILFTGPTGVGKTALADALIKDCGEYAVKFNPSQLAKKGQDIYKPSVLFNEIIYLATQMEAEDQKAYGGKTGSRNKSRILMVFLDEVHRFFPQADGAIDNPTGEALDWMNQLGEHKNVWVIGATNHPEFMDDAIASRFKEQLEIPLPDDSQLIDLLAYYIAQIDMEAKKQDRNLFDSELIKLVDAYRETVKDYLEYIVDHPKSNSDSDSTLKNKSKKVGDTGIPLAKKLAGVVQAARGLAHRDVAGVMESLAADHHVMLVQKDTRDRLGLDTEEVNGITLLDMQSALAQKRNMKARREATVRESQNLRRGRAA